MTNLPGVSEIIRVEIKPGDKIVVRVSEEVRSLTDAQGAELKARIAEALGLDDTNRVLILGPGLSISAMTEVTE